MYEGYRSMLRLNIFIIIFLILMSASSLAEDSHGPLKTIVSTKNLTAEVQSSLDLGNSEVEQTAITIAKDYPGEYNLNQVSVVYDALRKGWYYYSDPSYKDEYKNANRTLQDGMVSGTIGVGDCDDFAILMASLLESLQGSTRIVFAYDQDTRENHAYAEVYLGKESDTRIDELINWLKSEYNLAEIPGQVIDNGEVWLNLDYNSTYPGGRNYPGGQYFGGQRTIREIIWQSSSRNPPKIVPIIDTMDSTTGWETVGDESGSAVSISSVPSPKGKAIQIDYDLKEGGWAGISRNVSGSILSQVRGLNFSYFGLDQQITLELVLVYEDNIRFGYSWKPEPGNKWAGLEALFEDFTLHGSGTSFDSADQRLDPSKAEKLEIICQLNASAPPKTGVIIIDQIQGVINIPSDSPWARAEERRLRELGKGLLLQADSLKNQRGDQLPLIVYLSTVAAELYPSWDAIKALYESLAILPRQLAIFKHEGYSYDTSFSPDGRFIAIASYPGTAHVLDLTDGRDIPLNDKFVELERFSPDGTKLVTAGWNRSIKIWSIPDFKEIALINVTANVIEDASFSPNGHYLGLTDLNITKIFDTNNYQEILELDHRGRITSISFSPDSMHIATAGIEKNVRIWDIQTGLELESIHHDNIVNSVDYSPDGRYLATTSGLTAIVWEIDKEPKIVMQLHHDDIVYSAIFSPDSTKIATASIDNTARIWDLKSGNELTRMIHSGPVTVLDFSPNGAYISTGSQDNTSRIWETKGWQGLTSVDRKIGLVSGWQVSDDGKMLATLGNVGEIWNLSGELSEIFRIDNPLAYGMALSPSGKYIALAKRKDNGSIWSVIKREKISSFYQKGNFTLMLFSPNEKYLITATDDGLLKGWNVNPFSEAFQYSHKEPIFWASFDQKADCLTSLSINGEAILFDLKTKSEKKNLKSKGDWNFAISHDGNYLATSYRTNPSEETLSNLTSYIVAGNWTNTNPKFWLEVINISSNNVMMSRYMNYSIGALPFDIGSLVFSDDSKYIAAPVYNEAVVWRVDGGQQIANLVHTGIITRIAMSCSGQYLAATDANGLVRIWNITGGQEVLTIDNGMGLMSLAFSPDDKYLVTLAFDSSLKIWPLDQRVLINEARDRLTRNISAKELYSYLGNLQLPSGYLQERKNDSTWIDPELFEGVEYIVNLTRSYPNLNASPNLVEPGQSIMISYSGAPGNKGDWISIYPLGGKNEDYSESYYLGGNTSGELIFKAPLDKGMYNFRMFADWPKGGYDAIAISNPITISSLTS